MTIIQITDIIKGFLSNIKPGVSLENPKLDFKAKWHDLKNDEDINEFLKDSSAIANTPGLDGFIVYGYDEKTNIYTAAKFKDCNLRDENELINLLIKRVDRNFHLANYDIQIDGNNLSVLHIPPSFDKPHVIREYKKNNIIYPHRVFIRHGTTVRPTTKYDLDFIAYDRKNNTPEYSLFISCSKFSINVSQTQTDLVNMRIGLIIENNGIRPVAIKQLTLFLKYRGTIRTFISKRNLEEKSNENIIVSNIIVQSGTIVNLPSLLFEIQKAMTPSEFIEFTANYSSFDSIEAEVHLNTGRIWRSKIELI